MMKRTGKAKVQIAGLSAAGCIALASIAGGVLPASATPSPSPKNIILMISDGAGFNQFDSTNFYNTGKGAYQVLRQEDGTVVQDPNNAAEGAERYMKSDWNMRALSHYSQSTIDANHTYDSAKAWGDFEWVKKTPTDSAAAGTAMSTGTKTKNGILGYSADGQTKLTTAGEVAQQTGRKVGLVTSVPFNHATPAAFIAHNADRNDYQGLAKEMINSKADVIMGAGHPYYDDDHARRDADYTWIDAGDYSSLIGGKSSYRFIEEKSDFEALASLPQAATQEKCLAGVTKPDNQTAKPVFGLAQVGETLQERRADGNNQDSQIGVTPLNDVPTLETMTKGALNVLSQDSNGFFAMIEGGAIDWAGHSNFPNRLVEEQLDFNKSVDSVIDWVESYSSWDETLVIITADHETVYLSGPGANKDTGWQPMSGKQGEVPQNSWNSGDHTNSLVPIFFKGEGSDQLLAAADEEDSVRGKYLDNIELGKTMHSIMKAAPVSEQTGALQGPCSKIEASGENEGSGAGDTGVGDGDAGAGAGEGATGNKGDAGSQLGQNADHSKDSGKQGSETGKQKGSATQVNSAKGNAKGGRLSDTGSALMGGAVLGLAALAAGSGLLIARRRSQRDS